MVGATCKAGDDSLELSVGLRKKDEWVLLTFRHRGNRHVPEQYLIEWNEIQELLIDALSSAEGVTVLGWISYQEAISGP